MTTTNVYQGLASDKSTSRVLQAPGGGGSNIFGHYEQETERAQEQKRQEGTAAVMNSMSRAVGGGGDSSNSFQDNKDSFAANRNRNQGEGAPFATNNSLVATSNVDRPAHQQQVVGSDFETPHQRQAANRMRNHGSSAPFATSDSDQPTPQPLRAAHHQQTVGSDYQTPQQRQANNPNKAANSFSNLFGDTEADSGNGGKPKGKVSTHNPVTWEAYSNFDTDADHPQHRSRFENYASTKAGTFNPITGQDHDGSENPSTRVHNPPGGRSTIQF